jgi:hypothetical protein
VPATFGFQTALNLRERSKSTAAREMKISGAVRKLMTPFRASSTL